MPSFRIGHGYDIHRLVPGRPLVLGGVKFDTDYGLEGHSDADCLTHAICDALLGAAALPDIGRVYEEITKLGFDIVNIDASVIAEKPKLAPRLAEMKAALARSTKLTPAEIGLKATTNEGIDDIGRGLAIAAHAVCLLKR
jgi:2-C-methyl-D-erythritol 2,4-cyclodiphosphate synthase